MSSVLHGSCLVSFMIFLAKGGWNSNRRIKIFIREEQMLYLDCSAFNELFQLYIKKLKISTCTQNSFPRKIISPALHSSHVAFLPEALMYQGPLQSMLSEYLQGSSYILGFFVLFQCSLRQQPSILSCLHDSLLQGLFGF